MFEKQIISELTKTDSTPESESLPVWKPQWDYERAKLFFDPIPEKSRRLLKDRAFEHDPEKAEIGLVPPSLIVIGVLLLPTEILPLGLILIVIGGCWIGGIVSSTARRNTQAANAVARKNGVIDAENEKIAFENEEIDQFNRNRTVVNGEALDKICAGHLKSDLESMALKKLDIDKSQVLEVEPIVFDGYYYRELKTSEPRIKKCSIDSKERSSHYNAVMFFFSEDQVYCYQLRYSLLKDVKQESTDELFYRDIVSVATTSDTVRYGNNFAISFEEFTLTTSGGTKMEATVTDTETAERSIQKMRELLRRKKQQA